MFKLKHTAWWVAMACALPAQAAMNIQPDPQNPGGYLVAKADIAAAEQAKTANPMYAIWSNALATRANAIVDAIEPGLATNLIT